MRYHNDCVNPCRRVLWVLFVLGLNLLLSIAALAEERFTLMQDPAASTTYRIYSLEDNNTVHLNGASHALNRGDHFEVTGSELLAGDQLRADRDISIGTSAFDANDWVDESWAGTSFVVPHNRYTHAYRIFALAGEAQVSIDAGSSSQSITVSAGQAATVSIGSANGFAALITSDQPILLQHVGQSSGAPADVFHVHPAALSLVGVRSQTMVVGALENSTSVTVSAGNGDSESFTLNAGQRQVIAVGVKSSQGDADAILITADKKIGAIQYGDSDGRSAVALAPVARLAHQFLIPMESQYVSVICPEAGGFVRMHGDGLVPEEVECAGGISGPGLAYFGSTTSGPHIPSGTWIDSDNPAHLVVEPAANNEETHQAGLDGRFVLIDSDVATSDLSVIGLVNDTRLYAGSEIWLNEGEAISIPSGTLSAGESIVASEGVSLAFVNRDTLTPVTDRFLGRDFVVPQVRKAHSYLLLSPHEPAMVDVTINGSTTSVPLPAGQVLLYNAGSDQNVSAVIRASHPIFVAHQATSGNSIIDGFMVSPVATQVFGMRSKNAYVGALEDNTTVTVTASNGAQMSYSLSAGASVKMNVGSNGAQGAGSALRVVADKPIGAIQQADGDGSSSAMFLAREFADTRFALPVNAQYAFLVCADTDVDVIVQRPGNAPTAHSCSAAGDAPGRLLLGSTSSGTHLDAGTTIDATAPLLVVYEPSSSQEEGNLFGTRSKSRPMAPMLDAPPANITTLPMTVTGLTDPDALVWVFVDGSEANSGMADSVGEFSVPVNTLAEGNHQVHAIAEADGVQSLPSLVQYVTRVAGPSGPTLDPIASPTNSNPITVTGSTEAGATVDVYVNGVLAATVTADGSGLYSAVVPLNDGMNDIYVIATVGGVPSSPSNTVQVEYVNAVPRTQSGSIAVDTVWTKGDGQPYVLTADLYVDAGATLTISAGAQVIASNANHGLTIRGDLRIFGTEAEPVIMTSGESSPDRQDWEGIRVQSTGHAEIRHAIIEYAWRAIYFDTSSGGSVTHLTARYNETGVDFRQKSSATVTYSTIHDNRYGVRATGFFNIASNNPVPVINHSALFNNETNYEARFFGESWQTILDARHNWWGTATVQSIASTIYDRNDGDNESPFVDYGGYLDGINGQPVTGKQSLVGPITVDYSLSGDGYELLSDVEVAPGVTLTVQAGTEVICSHPSYGLLVDGTLVLQGSETEPVVFTSGDPSPARRDWQGIRIRNGGVLDLSYTLVAYAETGIHFESGASGSAYNATISDHSDGLYFAAGSLGTVSESLIQYNLTGIRVFGNNSVTSNPAPVVNRSALVNNSKNYRAESFGDHLQVSLNARENWWGTTDEAAIAESILDRNDGLYNAPLVDFSSYLDAQGGDPVSSTQTLLGTFFEDTVLAAGSYELLSSVYVNPGVTVTLQPGAQLSLAHPEYSLIVDGNLVIQGSAVEPVVITSPNPTGYGVNRRGIWIRSGGDLSADHVIVENMQTGVYFDLDASGSLTNASIRNNNTGVYFAARSSGTITGSDIYENGHGVSVIGDYQAANNPAPLVNGNSIYNNSTRNYSAGRFGENQSATLNARGNWWGTVDATEIAAKITDLTDGGFNSEPYVDFLDYLEAPDGLSAFNLFDVQITESRVEPLNAQAAQIEFITNSAATSRLRVFTDQGTEVLREYEHVHVAGERFAFSWDGRDQGGAFLADGIYRFELQISEGGEELVWTPDPGGSSSGAGLIPSEFDVFKNEFAVIEKTITPTTTPNDWSVFNMTVQPVGESTFVAVDDAPIDEGTHVLYWDGRRPDGSPVGVSVFIGISTTTLASDRVGIVGTVPTIHGTQPSPSIEVKSDPYLIVHSYDQFSNVVFQIDQDSYVTFKLLPPGVYDPDDAAAIPLISNQLLQATDGGGAPLDHTATWHGHNGTDTNNILTAEEGAFTFAIEATSATTGFETLYRGILQVRK